jgi:murein DD-endopeptidase MepM/ murein hydrolase activator NlpD
VKAVAVVALAFALGALTDAGLAWRLRQHVTPPSDVPVVTAEADADAPTGTTGGGAPAAAPETIAALREDDLEIPVAGVTADQLRDTFTEARGSNRAHEAIDIMAPRRTRVLAVRDGTVVKLFTSKQGGLTIYEFDPSQTFCYYYAHLDSYAPGIREGQTVRRGEVIGFVGSTGNASPDAPHLHFAIFRLTPEHQWWKGDPVNPYPVLAQK